MEKEFVTYEIALRLKQLGFDEYCLAYYTNHPHLICDHISSQEGNDKIASAPTWQSAFMWFRLEHGLYGIPEERTLNNFSYHIKSNSEGAITFKVYGGYPLNFTSYEESQEACLLNLCDIVESSKVQHKKEKITLEEAYEIAEKKKMTHILEDFLKESQGMSVEEIIEDFISHYNLHSN